MDPFSSSNLPRRGRERQYAALGGETSHTQQTQREPETGGGGGGVHCGPALVCFHRRSSDNARPGLPSLLS